MQTLAIAVDALNADKVYVGGDFSGGILRLNADASVDGSFVVGSGFDDRVTSIVPAADGSGDIYVGGFFSSYNGTLVSGLVRLHSDGSLDSVGFTAAPVSSIESVALAVDALFLGDIYSAGGTGVDRWGNSGIRDGSFNPPIASAFTVTPAADSSNAIFVSGSAATGIVRVNGDGSINGGFDIGSGFDSDVLSVIRADDMTGDIYAGGRFTTYDGGSANGIVRLNGVDGSRNVNFLIGNGFTNAPDDPSPLSTVSTLARATDGSTDVYVGGGFAFYNGTLSNGIVRLNDDGSLDTRFAVEIDVDGGLCTNETILGLD